MKIINWDIYEITTQTSEIKGVMLRGRIRKLCLENGRNVLAENATDEERAVRFALPTGEDAKLVVDYLHTIFDDLKIERVRENIPNPVLSKLKVNIEDRYTLN